MVYVAKEEVVDGAIPVASELVPRRRVPPVRVEAPVGEKGQLGQHIKLERVSE